MSHQNQNIKKVILVTALRNGSTLPPGGGGGGFLAMDNMTYNYYSNSNKLSHVDDAVSATNYTTDIDDQAAANYDYDEIGNLIKDNAEGIDANGIVWNVYGKIASVTKTVNDITTSIFYTYDANGNRIGKRVHKDDLGITQTWYVRDASGNVMAVYENNNGAVNNGMLTQTEIHLYGSSRLGLWKAEREVQTNNWWMFTTTAMPGTSNGGYTEIFTRGKTVFELSNHLGNVLVTVSDRKLQISDNGQPTMVSYYNADVMTANDYYPFGQTMPSRSYGNLPRYTFNGKEQDYETGYQDYGMRIYDGRLGRFLSVDPITKKYPELTPYQFASNSPIVGIDQDGLEFANWKATLKKKIYGVTALSFNNASNTLAGSGRIQTQSYKLDFQDPQKTTDDLYKEITTNIGAIYNTSGGDFSFEKQQNKGEINKNDYVRIDPALLGFGDIYVKVTAVNKIDDKDAGKEGFSYTFRTLEGHVEVGAITFSAYTITGTDNKKSFHFDIESTTQVDPFFGKQLAEKYARNSQTQVWEETLQNVFNFVQGKNPEAKRTSKEYNVGSWYGYKIIKNNGTSIGEPNPDAIPGKIENKKIEIKEPKK